MRRGEATRVDLDGIILIDKEEGITSFHTVQKVKSRLGVKKAGHAGTLDKAASGLLVVCINRATGVQNLFMSAFKRYRAELLLGKETDTLDRYGKTVKTSRVYEYGDDDVNFVLKKFLGKTKQVPPYFSAIHKDGKRLYKRALDGENITIEPREIEIKEISLLKNRKDRMTFEVLASKGTYIRSLGRDIARELDTCGYLINLRRLESGFFSVGNAVKLDEINEGTAVIPLNKALNHIPQINVAPDMASMIFNGVSLNRIFPEDEWNVLVYGYYRVTLGSRLIAIIEKREYPRYFRVFKDPEGVHNRVC